MNCQVIKSSWSRQKSPPTFTWCFWLAALLDCSSVSLVKGAKIHHLYLIIIINTFRSLFKASDTFNVFQVLIKMADSHRNCQHQ